MSGGFGGGINFGPGGISGGFGGNVQIGGINIGGSVGIGNGFVGGGVGISAGIGGVGLGLSVNLGFGGLANGQTFRTIPLPNNRPAIYGLSMRGSYGSLAGGFTFPLSPGNLRKEYNALSNVYDVRGQPAQAGVNRIMDSYGIAPVVFVIEGTTGWKRHSTDGYMTTGLQAIAALERFFFMYAQINASQAARGQPPITMEFYDYFRGDFWQVEPTGPQGVRMGEGKPILVYYAFRLAGIRDLTHPVTPENDSVSNVLSGDQSPNPDRQLPKADPQTTPNPDAPSNPNPGTGFPSVPDQRPPPAAPMETPADYPIGPSGVPGAGSEIPAQKAAEETSSTAAGARGNYAPVTPIVPDLAPARDI